MKITILPQDLNTLDDTEIQLYLYNTYQDLDKSKIQLSKNTISFLKAGTKEVVGKDHRVSITPKSFLMMKSGNCLMTEKISPSNRFYKSILLFFSDALVLQFIEKYFAQYKYKVRHSKTFHVFPYDVFTLNFTQSLENMLSLPPSIQAKILKVKFEELMLYITHHNGIDFLYDFIQSTDDKTSQLINVIENNKLNKLSVEELSFLCNMSISTFKRAFAKQYGAPPMKWFQEQRMLHVALLLQTQQKRPIELYEIAGYDNLSNFIQAFKKQFGMTPKQYQTQF